MQLSTIGRCEYAKSCAMLVQLFEQTAQRYQDLITTKHNSVPTTQAHSQTIQEIKVLEGEWDGKRIMLKCSIIQNIR